MSTQEQEGDPELTTSILDVDYTPSHIPELLTTQTNDRERYALTEKMILDLINKINERKDLVNERRNCSKTMRIYSRNKKTHFMSKKTCCMNENDY